MSSIQNRIKQLLQTNRTAQNPPLCTCAKPHPISLSSLVIEENGLEKLPKVIKSLGNFSAVVMICDEHTYIAAGQKIEKIYPLSGIVCIPTPKQAPLHADETAVSWVETSMGQPDLLLAVGAGTIHDITRFVANRHHLPFLSVPTAASVDGFLSSIAAMTWQGIKQSFPATPPIALVADTTVLANAPYRLTASGVGDLLGKYICLFDWKVSHMLTGEYICPHIISLVEDAVAALVSHISAIPQRNTTAVASLMYGLVLSGLAMQMVGNSRPASGAEHHISHLIEMEVFPQTFGNTALHGEKVGVATILLANQYHHILATPLQQTSPTYQGLPLARIKQAWGGRADSLIQNENTPDPLADVPFDKLCLHWEDIRTLAKNTLPSAAELSALLASVDAPTTLKQLDLPDNLWEDLWEMAPYVRRRLTFMRICKLLAVKPSSHETSIEIKRGMNMNHSVEVGIIGAMKIEVDALCDMMQDATIEKIAGIEFHKGTLCGRSVVVAQCGIGKVFAAMCAQAMILTYAPAVIVNTGVAGTLTSKLSIGQVAIADQLVQHDMDTTPLGDPAGLISGVNMVYFPTDPKASATLTECVAQEGVGCVTGTIASGDQFIATQAQKDFITSTFENMVACEMEGASIAHVCYMNQTPCAVLRAISDGGDDDAAMDYPTFCAHAAQVAIRVMVRFLGCWNH